MSSFHDSPATQRKNGNNANRDNRTPRRNFSRDRVDFPNEPLVNKAFSEGLQPLVSKKSLAVVSELVNLSFKKADPVSLAPRVNMNLRRIPNVEDDGKRFINIGPAAETDLGKLFSMENELDFDHVVLGTKVRSLWNYFLFLRDGARRKSILTASRSKMREVESLLHHRDPNGESYYPNMYALLLYAYHDKFSQYPQLMKLLMDYKGPIEYYRFGGYGPHRPRGAMLIIRTVQLLRDVFNGKIRLPEAASQLLDQDVFHKLSQIPTVDEKDVFIDTLVVKGNLRNLQKESAPDGAENVKVPQQKLKKQKQQNRKLQQNLNAAMPEAPPAPGEPGSASSPAAPVAPAEVSAPVAPVAAEASNEAEMETEVLLPPFNQVSYEHSTESVK